MDMTKAWEKFYRADPLTDKELTALILEAERAVSYLRNRGPLFYLASQATLRDLDSLYDYARNRRLRIGQETGMFPVPKEMVSNGEASALSFSTAVHVVLKDFIEKRLHEQWTSKAWNELFEVFVEKQAIGVLSSKVKE